MTKDKIARRRINKRILHKIELNIKHHNIYIIIIN